MEKQTAVEWLFERFIDLNADMKYSVIAWEEYLSKRADLLEQAKAIEKEQAILFLEEYDSYVFRGGSASAEEYYDETFIESE